MKIALSLSIMWLPIRNVFIERFSIDFATRDAYRMLTTVRQCSQHSKDIRHKTRVVCQSVLGSLLRTPQNELNISWVTADEHRGRCRRSTPASVKKPLKTFRNLEVCSNRKNLVSFSSQRAPQFAQDCKHHDIAIETFVDKSIFGVEDEAVSRQNVFAVAHLMEPAMLTPVSTIPTALKCEQALEYFVSLLVQNSEIHETIATTQRIHGALQVHTQLLTEKRLEKAMSTGLSDRL